MYDNETELYYLRSRYYDPETGRFVNADSLIDLNNLLGLNIFAYCLNNPVNYVDPRGECPICILENPYLSFKSKDYLLMDRGHSEICAEHKKKETINQKNANKLPLIGEPGSIVKAPNGNEREYGPDGRAKQDHDYSHPEHHPELDNPHDHDWEWEGDTPHRGDAHNIDIGQVALGAGLVLICTLGIVGITLDDVTGIGIADNFLYGPLGGGVSEGLIMIFGG